MVDKSHGQSIVEYIVILIVVVAALVTMNTYAKRGIQAHIKDAALVLGVQQPGETTQEFATRLQRESEPEALYGVSGQTVINSTTQADYNIQAVAGGTQTAIYNQTSAYHGTATSAQYDAPQ